MKEYRCKKCHKLLMRVGRGIEFLEKYEEVRTSGLDIATRISVAEIKCSKCKKINKFTISEEALCKL